jgi:hypothetical protein
MARPLRGSCAPRACLRRPFCGDGRRSCRAGMQDGATMKFELPSSTFPRAIITAQAVQCFAVVRH